MPRAQARTYPAPRLFAAAYAGFAVTGVNLAVLCPPTTVVSRIPRNDHAEYDPSPGAVFITEQVRFATQLIADEVRDRRARAWAQLSSRPADLSPHDWTPGQRVAWEIGWVLPSANISWTP